MNYFLLVSMTGTFLILLVISYYDLKTHLISDSHILMLLGCIFLYKYIRSEMTEFITGATIALLLNGIIFFITLKIYRSEEYGLGDVFLQGCMGAFFGPLNYFNFWLLYTTAIGALCAVLLLTGCLTKKSAMPQAPLISGCAMAFYAMAQPNFLQFFYR